MNIEDLTWEASNPVKIVGIITKNKYIKMEKKTRIPKQPESIFAAALKLDLEKRVELRDQLTDSIVAEVEALEKQYETAKRLSNGKQ